MKPLASHQRLFAALSGKMVDMRKHIAPALANLLAVPLVLVAIYLGTYYATVGQLILANKGLWAPSPNYGLSDWIGEDVAQQVFAPAHFLDCMVRPEYWRGGSLSDGSLPPGTNFF